MCSDSKRFRLRRLVDDSLRPYTESGVVLVTKEREILVTLSQLLRQVKLLIQALDSDSDNVVLLTVESQYVKHLTCNVLVAVSEFLAALGSNWGAFIHLLFVCMDLAITVVIQCISSHLTTEADDRHSGSSSLLILLKPMVENADWSVAAGVVRVLRDIRKYLKSEDDDELVGLFFDNVNSVLSTAPCNLLQGIHVGPNVVILRKALVQMFYFKDPCFWETWFSFSVPWLSKVVLLKLRVDMWTSIIQLFLQSSTLYPSFYVGALLSYDLQVLLDYLISKDTGISCAENLLRCLRKVCDSWSLFVEFLVDGQATNQSFCKKRKV